MLHTFRLKIIQNWQLLLIITFSVLLFSPALNNFFSGDDWFHLKVVQISSVREFVNFFNPVLNPQSIAFYRPIPTQLFFFIFNQIFGLWAFPYYVCIFGFFIATLYLFYQLLLSLQFQKSTALVAVLLFSVSHTHFGRLNFLSAGQEVMMASFFIAGVLSNQLQTLKSNVFMKTSLFFVLALLSKDTAIVFPFVVGLLDWVTKNKFYWKKMVGLISIAVVYAYIRFVVFDTTMTNIDAYKPNFSPETLLNTLYFYLLWALGGAELLQDYLRNPITLIERYFSDFGFVGSLMIVLLALNAALVSLVALTTLRQFSRKFLVPAILFVITLGPVLLLPQHKFTIQMTLPMMAFAALISWILENKPKIVQSSVILAFLALNFVSIFLTSQTHYTVQRSAISKKVHEHFSSTYPTHPANSYFVFTNANTPGSDLPTWGSSLQISHALWGSNFVKVFYNDFSAEAYFQDIEYIAPSDKTPIYIDSGKFL